MSSSLPTEKSTLSTISSRRLRTGLRGRVVLFSSPGLRYVGSWWDDSSSSRGALRVTIPSGKTGSSSNTVTSVIATSASVVTRRGYTRQNVSWSHGSYIFKLLLLLMKAVSPTEKSGGQRIEQVSTRVLFERATAHCVHCGSEVRLDRRHKYVSVRRPEADADARLEEFVLCDANCLSAFR